MENFEQHGLVETLMLTEGVEDGLSAVLAEPKNRTWAMISLSNMANVAARIPPFIDSVIVHRQNDWDKRQASSNSTAASRRCGRRPHGGGSRATYGKDLNDTLRGVA
jgi:hypothetical protein